MILLSPLNIFSSLLFLSLFSPFLSKSYINSVFVQKKVKQLMEERKRRERKKNAIKVKRKSNWRKLQNEGKDNYDLFERCDQGHQPDTLNDCTQYSDDGRSCCRFKYGTNIGCIYVPFRYLGETTVGDMTVTCNSHFLRSACVILSVVLPIILI